MVKGIAKRAVVVQGTGVDGFEQAIFISSGAEEGEKIASAAELLDAARRIAGAKARKKRSETVTAAIVGFLAGCAVTVFVWLLTLLA